MIEKPTVCGCCSCGCSLYVETADRRISALCPSANHPVSAGKLCIKGWNATPSILGADRLRTPLVRNGEALEPASWESAIDLTVSRLKQISAQSGPSSIGVIGSARTTNEESYSLAKFARAVIGTPNVDGAARFYDASLIPALLETTGVPASQAQLGDLAGAGSMLVVGANVMEQLPHIGSRIQEAAENGCKVVAADPRETRLAPHASIFLHPNPGTDLLWIRGLLKIIVDEQLYPESAKKIDGFKALLSSLEDVDLSHLEQASGVGKSELTAAAHTLSENSPLIVMFGLGVMQQLESTLLIKALADLALLLGGSVMPLRGQNNIQGASDMGLLHDFLPGYMPVGDGSARKLYESVWRCKLPDGAGKSALDMIRAYGSGGLRALLIFGENVLLSAPNTAEIDTALNTVGFLVVSDLYLTQTAHLADVVFPACSFLEKDGTFTSIERRVQRVRKAIDPLGDSRSDLDIIASLASGFGVEMQRDPAEVMREISSCVPQYKSISHGGLENAWGEPWPANGAKPKLAPIPAGKHASDEDYPFRLIAGRTLFPQQTGTICSHSGVLSREYPQTYAEIGETDLERLGLRAGSKVKITSRWGSLVRTAVPSATVPDHCVYVPHFFGGDSPNALASSQCDPVSGVPAYKNCDVRIEAVK